MLDFPQADELFPQDGGCPDPQSSELGSAGLASRWAVIISIPLFLITLPAFAPMDSGTGLTKKMTQGAQSLGALSVFPLISLSPPLLCRRPFQDSCWLDGFFSSPAYIYSWLIYTRLF